MAIQLIIHEPTGDTDQTGRIDYNAGFTWDLEQGLRGTATIPLRVFPPDTYRPTIGSPVFILEVISGTPKVVWAGKIMRVNRKWSNNQGCYLNTIACATLDSYFDTIEVYPPQYFEDMTCAAILTSIFNTFCSDCPITLGTIEDGPTITVAYTHREKIRDVFDDLKTKAGKIWGIRNADSKLYFQDSDTTVAPHVLTTFQFDTGSWDEDQTDYRNEQTIRISFNAFTPSCEMFDGDETTEFFNMTNRVDRIVSAMITNSVRASVTASFPGSPPALPVDGDTFTISRPGFSALAYTWKDVLDNTELRQVKIAATVEGCAHNAVDAILALPFHAGITFSLPTWQNEFCIAEFPETGSSTFAVRVKFPGTGGNIVTVAQTGGNMVWSNTTCTGGTDGDTNSSLRFSVIGSGDLGSDLQYSPGSNIISSNSVIQGGVSLLIAYYRSGADCITVRDSVEVAARAAAEGGPGLYAQLMNDTNNTDARAAYIKVLTVLNQFKTIPKLFECGTLRPEYEPGQLLTITITSPTGASTDLNGLWLLQHVQGKLEGGYEKLPEPAGHFIYSIKVLSVNQIGTKVSFWETLALTAPSGSQSVSNLSTTTATPKLQTPGTLPSGTPATGAPTATAGQQWVQEQIGPATEQEFTDLAVDSGDSSKVSSASYTFVSDDVDKIVQTFAGGAWTDSSAKILSVAAGVATVDSVLAAAGSTGGHWRLFNPKVLGFTWTPTRSIFTNNQVAIVIKLASDGGSPASYTTVKLSPFRRSVVGYSLDTIDPSLGPDYTINGNNLILQTKPNEGDVFVTEYFPSGPKRIPPTPTPPASGQFVGLFIDADFTTWSAATSPDGITWTTHTVPQTTSLYFNIIFGGGKYVAVGGNDGSVIYSSDGITWTSATSVVAAAHGVAYGAGLYVVVGWHSGGPGGSEGTGYIMTSPDAVTWTARTVPNNNQWSDVCFGNGIFVAVATLVHTTGTGQIMTSTDGITWTASAAPAVKQWSNIRFLNGLFVAGVQSSGSTQAAMTSPDGITWTLQTTPSPNRSLEGIAYGAGKYVFACSSPSGTIAVTSSDGATWSDATASTDSAFGMAFGNDLFVAVTFFAGSVEQVWTSPDGVTWTARSTAFDNGGALCVCFGD